MNIYSAGLCFLPSVLLIIFSLGSVRSASSRATIACPGTYNCSCKRGASSEYQLLCPGDTSVLSAFIIPEKYVHIECTYSTHFTDYALLRGLQVGGVNSVNFRLCPLPNMSLSELIRAIGVNSTNSLLFQSYRNLSNTLEKKHLIGLGNITRLLLSSNGLTDLPEDLLQDLANLTWLDLRGNNVHLHPNFFKNVPKLEFLELGNNGLRHLEPGVFANLTRLKFLNLWKNQLRNLTRGVFSDLVGLQQLDLNTNDMVTLHEDVFHDLSNLVNLSIYSNNYTALPSKLFSGNPNLELLRLYNNRQALILEAGILSNLTHLKYVYLKNNNMSSVPEDLFWGSPAITNLSFTGNSLRELPIDLFRDQTELRTLELDDNLLQDLPDFVFRKLTKLETLRLGHNRLQSISRNVFEGLENLVLLDLERNNLSSIDSDALGDLRSLRHARLSHNRLSFLQPVSSGQGAWSYEDTSGSQSPFRNCMMLEYLYLANNTITDVFYDWRIMLTRLRMLDLSYNNIRHLVIYDVHFLSNELSVDLRHNNISIMDFHEAETLALSQTDVSSSSENRPRRNVRVLLEGNPLNCDCRAYDLVRYFETKLDPEVYMLVTLVGANLTCQSPRLLRGTVASKADSRTLTCPLPATEFCPARCSCSVRRSDLGLIVNCASRGLTSVPDRLPYIQYINHTELILENNNITSLPNVTVDNMVNVTHLYLSKNNLSEVDLSFIPPHLQVLAIDNNHIQTLSASLVRALTNSTTLTRLLVHNNPWSCDCSARDLLNLLQLRYKQVPFPSNITCFKDKRLMSKMLPSDLCPESMAVILSCVLVAACGIMVGSLAALYYRYHREVKVWLYSHHIFLWLVTEQELDKDKLFDAFVSYSHKDEDFVVNTLVPGLEPQFKLCLHYRDWIAGEWIPNQIARSVEDSRRTLVVLSPNFLESVWGRMEFRAAHKQALSEGRARVIVLLYGDVGPTDDLDPELRAYISMNTYVKWGDPWFWDKLRYALPHPPDLFKGNVLKRRGSRKEKNFIDDKLELIHTLDSPTTPTGATTPPAEAAVTTIETITLPNGLSLKNGQAKLA